MVGTAFCKCLQNKNLYRAFLLMLFCCFISRQVAVSGAVVNAASPTGQMVASEILLEFAPEAVTFEGVPVGEVYTQTVTIMNRGDKTLQIKKISSPSAEFQVSGILLPVVVAHGTSESVTISFRPKKEGRVNGQISIFTGFGDAPIMLKVSASTIVEQTELTASEAAIGFEDVAIGGTGTKEVTLTNSGARDLTISDMSATGMDFSLSGAAGVRLAPGQSVTVGVNFEPKSAGRQSGQLTIAGTDGGSLLLIPLTARGAESSRTAVKLNWEESPVTVAGYIVYRSADSSGPYTRISQAATAEYLDTGLAAGHTYFYIVTSMDANEVESEFSPPISATVPEG
jgi:hypothetical protein